MQFSNWIDFISVAYAQGGICRRGQVGLSPNGWWKLYFSSIFLQFVYLSPHWFSPQIPPCICETMPLKAWPNAAIGCNHQLQSLCSAALVPMYYPEVRKARAILLNWYIVNSRCTSFKYKGETCSHNIPIRIKFITPCMYMSPPFVFHYISCMQVSTLISFIYSL